MDIPSVIFVSFLFLLASIGMIISHIRSWKAYQQEDLHPEELDYRRRQFRRRMQTSAMLGILAIAMAVGYILTVWLRSGWFALVFWLAAIGLACWVALLALVDIWATKHHFGRMRDNFLIEQAKLKAQLREHAYRGNGKHKKEN